MLLRSTAVLLLSGFGLPAFAQTAQSVRVVKQPEAITGSLVVTVDGTRKTIAQDVWTAWRIQNGKAVAYATPGGAGGYENEGQALWVYDVSTGRRKKVMSEIYVVHKVVDVQTRSGKTALLVTMRDGGLGATHVAVVDPRRGEVWRMPTAVIVGIRSGRIAVADYTAQDFAREGGPGKPRRMIYLDLDKLLCRPARTDRPV